MKLVADENIDRGIVDRLRRNGHVVEWIAEVSPGASDEDILRRADEAGALLVTEENDFGELVYRRVLWHAGVLLVRLEGLDSDLKAALVADAVRDNATELTRAFAVISADSIQMQRPEPGSSVETD